MKTSDGWSCVDCVMLFANGELPVEMGEQKAADWLAEIQWRTEGYDVVVGGKHDFDCPNHAGNRAMGRLLRSRLHLPANDQGTDCGCEHIEFSWSQCDTCGSTLGGSREAVTFFERTL